MKLLEDMILKRGRVLDGNILKVDNFLNHQIDQDLFMEMGKDYYDHFKDKGITSIFGAGPNTAFSQNVGLITLTKVASRHVMIIAGIILAILGVFPKLSALIAVMPSPVLGGVGVIMFGLVAAQGIKTLASIELGDRELLIISVAFALGIGVTVKPEILQGLPNALKMILSSGISTGTLAALILNIVLVDRRSK